MRLVILLAALAVAACGLRPTGPAGQPSSTDVNPITGARGGTSAGSSR
jgi:hypothetical protein